MKQKELEELDREHQEADRELESLEENVESQFETTIEDEPKKGLFSDIPFELELNYEKNFAAMEDEPEAVVFEDETVSSYISNTVLFAQFTLGIAKEISELVIFLAPNIESHR